MAELNIPLWKVYELAADQAVERWAEVRHLAGLDCTTDADFNYLYSQHPASLRRWLERIQFWSDLTDALYEKSRELQRRNSHDTE